jgi:hypothetical protein
MTKQAICDAYQKLIRQVYPKAVVMPDTNDWNPYKDECYYAFFIPDGATAEFRKHWRGENGWYERAEKMGLPFAGIWEVDESTTREEYSHLFPEIFGKKASAKTKRSKVKPAKQAAPKPARVRAKAS